MCCCGTCQNLTVLCLSSSSNSVKFSKLLSIVLSTWFTAAGFIHLVSILSPVKIADVTSQHEGLYQMEVILRNSYLHHFNQCEVYLFASFFWVFSTLRFLTNTNMYLLHSRYLCSFFQLSKSALREGSNKLFLQRYKQ